MPFVIAVQLGSLNDTVGYVPAKQVKDILDKAKIKNIFFILITPLNISRLHISQWINTILRAFLGLVLSSFVVISRSLFCKYRLVNDFTMIVSFLSVNPHDIETSIPLQRYPKPIYHMRKHLHNEMKNLSPVANIYPVLEKLCNANFSLGILTSNSVKNVSMWLDFHKMHHFFEFIHIESNYFSKKYLLKKTIKKYKIDKSQTYYICDETRDIDAANKNDVKSVAVTWGYNSETTLLQFQPSFVAKNPEDLLTICGL